MVWITLVLTLCVSLMGCSHDNAKAVANEEVQQTDVSAGQTVEKTVGKTDEETVEKTDEKAAAADSISAEESGSMIYENSQYGFRFTLPKSWQGYTIVTDKWEGLSVGEADGDKVVETGPLLIIRHPEWTKENPRQDIPIMVFTLAQWDALQQEKFHIGAAPIGPSELGRNSGYVFALPARYNFSFPTGYEEVEDMLSQHPLQPFEVNRAKP